MRNILACSLIALGMTAVAAPAMAQGVYIGPGGVGVDTGIRHGYDRDRGYRDHDRGYYEGRSVYRDRDRDGYRSRYRDDDRY